MADLTPICLQPLSAASSYDSKLIIGSDTSGGVRFWKTDGDGN